jgi:hypothetical protein
MPVFLRDREVLDLIITAESAGERCVYCRLPVVQGRFHWLNDDGTPVLQGGVSNSGEIVRFPSWRHADGSPGHGVDGYLVIAEGRCPECGAYDSDALSRRDTGYGDDVTCTACGWNKYFGRGD